MGRISNAALEALRAGKRQSLQIIFEPVTVTGNQSRQLTITESDIVSGSFSIDRYSLSGNKIEFGCCSAAELRMTLDNSDGRFSGYTFGGGTLTVSAVIPTGSSSTETIGLGVFYIDNMPRRLSHIEITALDRMVSLQTPVSSATKTWLQGKHTIWETLGKIISDKSLTDWSDDTKKYFNLVSGEQPSSEYNALVNNSNLKFSLKDGEEITYHELLIRCCELAGLCAYFDGSGYLAVAWYNDDNEINLLPSDRYSSDIYEAPSTITGIKYVKQDGTTVTCGTNEYEISEGSFNPDSDSENAYVQALCDLRNGFSYTPFSATIRSFPQLFPLDSVNYVREEGNSSFSIPTIITHTVYRLNHNMEVEGVGETSQQSGFAQLALMSAYERSLIERFAQQYGKSAYQIAVENGFNGTEAEWLESLNGANGDKIETRTRYRGYSNAQTFDTNPTEQIVLNYWSASPISVSTTNRFVYITTATYKNDSLVGRWSMPALYSKYTEDGEPGAQGEPGVSVSSIVEEFIKTDSQSRPPSHSDPGWSPTVPEWEEGKYIWTRIVTTYNDSRHTVERSAPQLATSINNAGRTAAAALDFNRVISSGMGLLEYTDPTTQSKYYYCGKSCVTGYRLAVEGGFIGDVEGWVYWLESSSSDSDYDDAVSGGFDGTKAEWVSWLENLLYIEDADYIVKFDSGGFAYSYKWNNGNPTWIYGIDRNGNAILNILTAKKINADQIEAGAITADKIQVGAVDADRINATGLSVDGSNVDFGDGLRIDKVIFDGKTLKPISNAIYKQVSVKVTRNSRTNIKTINGTDYSVFLIVVQLRANGAAYVLPLESNPIQIDVRIKYITNGTKSTTASIEIHPGVGAGNTSISIAHDAGIAPEIILCTPVPGKLSIPLTSASLDGIGTDCDFVPSDDDTYSLGYVDTNNPNNSKRWKELRAGSSTIVTSDRKEKYDIYNISPKYSEMFDRLTPVQYKFINGSSGRTHIGFVAQDVEQAMQDADLSRTDFAGLCVDGNQYGLRYEEFIALCVNEIQHLKARVEELEQINRS